VALCFLKCTLGKGDSGRQASDGVRPPVARSKIEFLAEDRKGFWEIRGYSNSAEPWFNDRYSTE